MGQPASLMSATPNGSAPAAGDLGPEAPGHADWRLAMPPRARPRAAPGGLTVTSPKPRPAKPPKDRRVAALVRIAAKARKRLRHAEEALAEQRLLAREADHRVANWLQLLHSTLSLQAAAAPDGASREAIRAAASSVTVAAEAHRHLHTSVALRPTVEA